MASEYTHVIQAKGKDGSWKNMTKHIGMADAKSSVADAKKASKTGEYRVVKYGEHTNTSPVKKPATKAVAKPKSPVKKGK